MFSNVYIQTTYIQVHHAKHDCYGLPMCVCVCVCMYVYTYRYITPNMIAMGYPADRSTVGTKKETKKRNEKKTPYTFSKVLHIVA
jgi:hypothetical protein